MASDSKLRKHRRSSLWRETDAKRVWKREDEACGAEAVYAGNDGSGWIGFSGGASASMVFSALAKDMLAMNFEDMS